VETRDLFDMVGMSFEEFKLKLFSISALSGNNLDCILDIRQKVKNVFQLKVLEKILNELNDQELKCVSDAVSKATLRVPVRDEKLFMVEVIETYSRRVPVVAESAEEAVELTKNAYARRDIAIDKYDFDDVEYECSEVPANLAKNFRDDDILSRREDVGDT